MKICLVNGSPRKNGATAKILHYMQSYLGQKDGLELQYVDLSDYQITLCKGCVNCYKTGECFIKDDGIEALARQVKSADGIIIGTPTFGSDITSYLKAFFDRGHFIVEQSLAHKYGFSIVTYQIAEGQKALNTLKKFFLVSGASRQGSLLVKTDINQDPLSKAGLEKKINARLDRYYRAVKRGKKKSFWEHFFMNVVVIPLIWRPKFEKCGDMYAGVLRIWKAKGII